MLRNGSLSKFLHVNVRIFATVLEALCNLLHLIIGMALRGTASLIALTPVLSLLVGMDICEGACTLCHYHTKIIHENDFNDDFCLFLCVVIA